MRLLALGGVAGPVLFAAVVVAAGTARGNYSHISNFVSELGATGTPYAALMNYAGFLPTGLMLAAFGIGLAKVLPGRRVASLAAVLVMLFGAGVAASGIASCDPGCPQTGGSVENAVHNAIAPVAFLCLIAGAGVLGVHFRSNRDWRSLSAYSLTSSVIALCFLVALAMSLDSRELTGLWQRLLLFVLFLWCGVVGMRAYRLSAHG